MKLCMKNAHDSAQEIQYIITNSVRSNIATSMQAVASLYKICETKAWPWKHY